MSFALYNELRRIQEQILELVKRIEALEDANEEAKRRRPVLTLPKQKAFNAEN
jgi:hypothetical protein